MISITKCFRPICVGHILEDVQPCNMVHGHSLDIELDIRMPYGDFKGGVEGNRYVVELSRIKPVERVVRRMFDHKFLVDKDGAQTVELMRQLLVVNPAKVLVDWVALPCAPTIENLAVLVWAIASCVLFDWDLGQRSIEARVSETSSSWAAFDGFQGTVDALPPKIREFVTFNCQMVSTPDFGLDN